MVEQRRDRQPQRVRVLVRDVDLELARLGVEVGEDRTSFERDVGHALLRERLRHDRVRLRERGVDVAVAVLAVVHDVGAELLEQRCARRIECVGDRHHRGQRLDVDVDELARVLGERTALGHDDRERLAGAPHLVVGKHAGTAARKEPFGP